MNAGDIDGADLMQGSCGKTTTADQLAELQLLTRADHMGTSYGPPLVRGYSTLMLDIVEHPIEERADDDGGDHTNGTSSFTAMLAASRRLAGSSPTHPNSPPASPDSPRHGLPMLESPPRRPATLPTLCEEADEPATDYGPETNAQQEASQSSELLNPADAHRGEDCSATGAAFEQMLEQLPYGINALVLSVSDLSVQNLIRARGAISQCMVLTTTPPQTEPAACQTKMRIVRAILAVDTLRMFLLRYGNEKVLRAVTDAIRRIYEQYAIDHGVLALAHSHGVLTASNITRVVLLVHGTLQKKLQNDGSLVDNNMAERSSPSRSRRGSCSPTKSSPLSWHTCRSPSSSYPSSPSHRGMLSPRATTAASPCSPASSASSSSLRRSILASDGAHVLLSEKHAMYQHRCDMNRLPSFKVRRESDDATEEAARRRQRSIQYGNDVTKALRGENRAAD